MKVIADTGYLWPWLGTTTNITIWAAEVAEQISWPALTCKAVLAETAFHLQSSYEVLAMMRDNIAHVAFDCESNLEYLCTLGKRYAERHPDLADLCLIRMSELFPRHYVATTDGENFRVYRRNKREAIPLLTPPRK